jgi:hypothetical protein
VTDSSWSVSAVVTGEVGTLQETCCIYKKYVGRGTYFVIYDWP